VSGYLIRAEADAFLAELAVSLPREAGRRLVEHAPELAKILRAEGFESFERHWRATVDSIVSELEAEALARLRALEVAGSA